MFLPKFIEKPVLIGNLGVPVQNYFLLNSCYDCPSLGLPKLGLIGGHPLFQTLAMTTFQFG